MESVASDPDCLKRFGVDSAEVIKGRRASSCRTKRLPTPSRWWSLCSKARSSTWVPLWKPWEISSATTRAICSASSAGFSGESKCKRLCGRWADPHGNRIQRSGRRCVKLRGNCRGWRRFPPIRIDVPISSSYNAKVRFQKPRVAETMRKRKRLESRPCPARRRRNPASVCVCNF